MLELVHYTSNVLIDTDFNWTSGLLLSSLLSLIIGTVLGLTQSRIKRLFAYSTISHLGFILLALSVNSIESNQSFIFSFVGIPPLIGFFAKQMVLSSALDKGYIFLVLIAILTSVIAAVYYLAIIRKMYFDKHEYIVIK